MDLLRDLFEVLLQHFGFDNTESKKLAIITFGCFIILGALYKLIKEFIKWHQVKKLQIDLQPYYSKAEITRATKYFIDTNCQNIAPSHEQEPKQARAFITKESLIPFFIKSFHDDDIDQRFYLILADSGMGKTTFAINLYLKYVNKITIKKKHSIAIFPFAYPSLEDKIKEINNKSNTILILDAFDEDPKAVLNYENRINDLIDIIYEFRIVIITCRTQFFPNEDKELRETGIMKFGVDKGYHLFYKLYISPFDEKDILRFLKKRYNILNYVSRIKAKSIIKQSPNLMVRPMLLNYVDDLMEFGGKFDYTYQVYKSLIDKWIDREARRVDESKQLEFRVNLKNFSSEMAIYLYNKQTEDNNLVIDQSELFNFKEIKEINLESWEITGRSLLNRNAVGQYKFSHKSILEYLVAINLFKKNPGEIHNLKNNFDFCISILTEILHNGLIHQKGEYRTYGNWFGSEISEELNRAMLDGLTFKIFCKEIEQDIRTNKFSNSEINRYIQILAFYKLNIKLKEEKNIDISQMFTYKYKKIDQLTIEPKVYEIITDIANIFFFKTLFGWLFKNNLENLNPDHLPTNLSEIRLSSMKNAVTHIEITYNETTAKLIPLFVLFKNLVSLKIVFEKDVVDFDIKNIPNISKLTILELSGNCKIHNLDNINTLEDIEYIIISGNKFLTYLDRPFPFKYLKIFIADYIHEKDMHKFIKFKDLNRKVKFIQIETSIYL